MINQEFLTTSYQESSKILPKSCQEPSKIVKRFVNSWVSGTSKAFPQKIRILHWFSKTFERLNKKLKRLKNFFSLQNIKEYFWVIVAFWCLGKWTWVAVSLVVAIGTVLFAVTHPRNGSTSPVATIELTSFQTLWNTQQQFMRWALTTKSQLKYKQLITTVFFL